MNENSRLGIRRWLLLILRSAVAGAPAGVVSAGLIFFGFGFIGLEGGNLSERLENGWDAAAAFGMSRGLVLGVAIAVGLALAVLVWNVLTDRVDPTRARPWLAASAALVVVLGNLRAVGTGEGWDEVALVTIVFMATVAAVAVWLVSPWVLRSVE